MVFLNLLIDSQGNGSLEKGGRSVPTSSVSNNGAMKGSVFFMAVYKYRVHLSPGVGRLQR